MNENYAKLLEQLICSTHCHNFFIKANMKWHSQPVFSIIRRTLSFMFGVSKHFFFFKEMFLARMH